MGTRDIGISILMTILFLLLADYLLNEQSKYCIIPNRCKVSDLSGNITQKEVNDSIEILKRAHAQKKHKENNIEHTLFKENFCSKIWINLIYQNRCWHLIFIS